MGLPPFEQLPTPQLNNPWIDNLMLNLPLDFLLYLSEIIWMVAKAQDDVQSWGVTALLLGNKYKGSS